MEKDMNKTAENRRNAAESVLNGGIEYSAFENMDRLAAIFAMQKLLNDDIAVITVAQCVTVLTKRDETANPICQFVRFWL